MENEIHRKIAERIAQHLPKYQELIRKRSSVERRLEKANEEKGTVKKTIFERVKVEYQAELERLASDLKPVEEEIDKIRRMIRDETGRIDGESTSLEDQLEELQFRHRVGEYDSGELSRRCSPVKGDLAKLKEQRQQLDRQLEQLDAVPFAEDDIETYAQPSHSAADTPEEPATSEADSDAFGFESLSKGSEKKPDAPAPVGIQAGMPSTEPAEGASESSQAGGTQEDAGIVNPADWMQEFEQEDRREQEGRRATDSGSFDLGGNNGGDAAATATDTTPKSDKTHGTQGQPSQNVAVETEPPTDSEKASTPTRTTESPKSFPVLIITKGPGAGKKLPLVPMTMTLGREHDNNIEIKDEDVARYHARIAYEKGKYIIQDLESSSGTWVNDARLSKPEALAHGDKIRLGNTELMIDFD